MILHDKSTGEEWLVEVGDDLRGYRVVEITEEYVTLAELGEDQTINMTQIPFGGGGVVEVKP